MIQPTGMIKIMLSFQEYAISSDYNVPVKNLLQAQPN